MQKQPERIILGIDPGTIIMGYGIIRSEGSQPALMDMGVLSLHRETDPFSKLQKIFNCTVELIDRYLPDELAIEAPFYGKNVQSMLKLGRAQGVAIAAALSRSVPVFEYAPRKIKLAITGVGNASKEQVASMLCHLFSMKELPKNLDATDGLAAAVCHFYQQNLSSDKPSARSWKEYIRKNPGKLR
ncbi:MAG: crossover junction endodeoxyribonuclease RuvC [Bacteroidales bacterium]|nr:crossover junction endodeoxyribonuclease RuvC [Bacteroidales bacterium]